MLQQSLLVLKPNMNEAFKTLQSIWDWHGAVTLKKKKKTFNVHILCTVRPKPDQTILSQYLRELQAVFSKVVQSTVTWGLYFLYLEESRQSPLITSFVKLSDRVQGAITLE